jgi:hypothetical protein
MKRTTSLVTSALVVASAVVGSTASAERPPRAPAASLARGPGPEHARLTAMAGTWDVEMTFWFQPGSPPS